MRGARVKNTTTGEVAKGHFWEDRYHATAVESETHLFKCLVYMGLNMVRAGVVNHPEKWAHGGYQEIQKPPKRYCIIDTGVLMKYCDVVSLEVFQNLHRNWVEDELQLEPPRMKTTGRRVLRLAVNHLSTKYIKHWG